MIDIKQMAKLARIKLSPEEESILEEQMNLIIGYVEQLNEVGPLSVEPLNNGPEEAQLCALMTLLIGKKVLWLLIMPQIGVGIYLRFRQLFRRGR